MHIIALIFAHALLRPLFMWPATRLGHGIREFWKSARTSHWFITHGTVIAASAKKKGYHWTACLSFYYIAESATYPGLWHRLFVFETELDRFLRKYREGSLITIRYRPGHVSQSIVLDADQKQTVIGQPMPEQMEDPFRLLR